MNEIQFPIKYYEKNILFTQDNESWAFYELIGFEYDFLSDNKKASISSRLETFFANIGVDTHLLILPKFHSVLDKHEQFKKTIKGPLKDEAIRHVEEVAPIIENAVGSESSDYHFFIGIKLPKTDEFELTIKNIIENVKSVVNEIFAKMGLEEQDIAGTDIDRANRLENLYFKFVSSHVHARRIDEDDYQWLIRRNFYRGIGIPPHNKDFKPSYQPTIKARKPLNLLHLTEGIVDGFTNPRKILLTQAVDGEVKNGHCAFLTISYIPTDGLINIDTEWIFAIQTLDFPVEISIRSSSLDHRKVMQMVRNKKKELKNLDEHAASTNNESTYEVSENVSLARELEIATNVTKNPQLFVTVAFCVSASNEEELKSRIRATKDLYADFKFQLEQPLSDQYKLFNEFIPGSKQYVNSYVQMMEPGALAAGMFGATTQIGDSNGFCVGTHGDDQAVYIDIRRYTQGLAGAKSRSLSMDFIGSKGSGKSYGADLMLYLAILAGAKGFVVDPKGDRTKWKELLRDIGHEVNVITLEANERNKGRLDPFIICKDLKAAEKLALVICTYLTKLDQRNNQNGWVAIRNAVRDVAAEPTPCMNKIISKLKDHPEGSKGYDMGAYLETYRDLSFASLLFGDGSDVDALDIDNALTVLQIQNLKMPPKNKKSEDFNMEEMLSMAMMFPIGEFALEFIHQPRNLVKIAFFDESWFMEKTDIGRDILDRVSREGRAMNAGLIRATQATNDIDENTKNLVGMKFVFQNSDHKEAANSLKFLGIEPTDQLIERIQNLNVGECFMQDIYGRIGIVQLNAWFKDLDHAFDTRPPIDQETETEVQKELVLT
ncbi:ATP-binding protein [Peribacillus sp. NPDC096622]|uniref:ATP-binding protein n=1 Tax=Peribacillus sp. NPDC096622 TaxID=3364396 RepID=UPI003817975A